jgi:hypothetical protein
VEPDPVPVPGALGFSHYPEPEPESPSRQNENCGCGFGSKYFFNVFIAWVLQSKNNFFLIQKIEKICILF